MAPANGAGNMSSQLAGQTQLPAAQRLPAATDLSIRPAPHKPSVNFINNRRVKVEQQREQSWHVTKARNAVPAVCNCEHGRPPTCKAYAHVLFIAQMVPLAVVTGTIMFLLSKFWSDMLGIYLFAIGPVPLCEELGVIDSEDACTPVASAGAQVLFACIQICPLPPSMRITACPRSPRGSRCMRTRAADVLPHAWRSHACEYPRLVRLRGRIRVDGRFRWEGTRISARRVQALTSLRVCRSCGTCSGC
jgi:hypothetical protein